MMSYTHCQTAFKIDSSVWFYGKYLTLSSMWHVASSLCTDKTEFSQNAKKKNENSSTRNGEKV